MFELGNVTVDDRFARFGSKSFAINKITSVDVRSTFLQGDRAYLVWWPLAVLSVVAAFWASLPGILILTVVLAIMGWRAWKQRHPVTTYRLFLMTAAGEAQAFETNDGDEVTALREAIESAMARSS